MQINDNFAIRNMHLSNIKFKIVTVELQFPQTSIILSIINSFKSV